MRGAVVKASAAAVALAVTSLAMAAGVPGVAGSESASGPTGYVTVETTGGSCELARVDLTTGVGTDLPAAADPVACVVDLAVAPDGGVWGLTSVTTALQGAAAPAKIADAALVRFDASGEPTVVPLTTGVPGERLIAATGGIAVTAGGKVLVNLKSALPLGAASTGAPVAAASACDSRNCLYSVDPTSGLVTPIGNMATELVGDDFWVLAACRSTAWTADLSEVNALRPLDVTTGEVGPEGATVTNDLNGFDCDAGASTTWALTDPRIAPQASAPQAAVVYGEVSRMDFATGAMSGTVAVTGLPAGSLFALGVVPTAAPTTPTTPTTAPVTTTPAAAQPATVTPTFTG